MKIIIIVIILLNIVYSILGSESTTDLCSSYIDYCGVCGGDGSTCCNPNTICNDNNNCTIDRCPPPDTVIYQGYNLSDYCEHIPIINPNSLDKCHTYECDQNGNYIIKNETICGDYSNLCLIKNGCNFNTGCSYKSICTGKCDTGSCNNGVCIKKQIYNCIKEFEKNGFPDSNYIYSCDPNIGCKKTKKTK